MSKYPFKVPPRPFHPQPPVPSWKSTLPWIIAAIVIIGFGAAVGVAHP